MIAPLATSRTSQRAIGFATALLVFAFVELLWIQAFPLGHLHTGDTDNLVAGARTALDCVDQGTWRGCAHVPGNPGTGVFPYPLLQYLPATFAVWLGASDTAVLGFLARISVLAFAGCLGLIWFALRERPRLAALGVLAVLGSAATYQATSAFGEMLAALVVVAAIVAVRSGRPATILATCLVACIAKETLAPFVVLLGLVAGRPDDRWLPRRRVLVPLVIGAGFGVFLNIGFNLFRFGSPRNLNYLQSFRRTPGIGLKLELFVAEWASPVAGLLWTWSIASGLIIVVLGIGLVRLVRNPRNPVDWLPSLAASGVAVAFTAILATWFAPFGWSAYGHRLAVPILPAVVLVCLLACPIQIYEFLHHIGRRTSSVVVAILLLLVVAWPQTAAPWTWRDSLSEMRAENPECNQPVMIETMADLYFECLTDVTWPEDLSVRRAAFPDGSVPLSARAASLTAVLGLALVVIWPERRPVVSPETVAAVDK